MTYGCLTTIRLDVEYGVFNILEVYNGQLAMRAYNYYLLWNGKNVTKRRIECIRQIGKTQSGNVVLCSDANYPNSGRIALMKRNKYTSILKRHHGIVKVVEIRENEYAFLEDNERKTNSVYVFRVGSKPIEVTRVWWEYPGFFLLSDYTIACVAETSLKRDERGQIITQPLCIIQGAAIPGSDKWPETNRGFHIIRPGKVDIKGDSFIEYRTKEDILEWAKELNKVCDYLLPDLWWIVSSY